MQPLFHPVRLLLSRFHHPWVVAACGLAIAGLLAGLAQGTFGHLLAETEANKREIAGLASVARLRAVLQPLQEHRGLDNAIPFGDPVLEAQLTASEKRVDAAFTALLTRQALASEHAAIVTQGRADWDRLKNAIGDLNRFEQHSALIDRLLEVARRIIDDSGLTLDADAGTNHLVGVLDVMLGFTLERAAQLRGLYAALLASNGTNTRLRGELVMCATALDDERKLVSHHVAAILRYRPDLAAELGDLPTRLEQSTRTLRHLVREHVVAPGSELATETFFKQASVAISGGYALFDRTLVLAERSLRARQERLKHQLSWNIAGMLALTLAILYLFAGVVVSVRASRRATDELARNEALFRNVLDTLPVGVAITDAKGQILSINPAAQRIWGEARLVGQERYHEYKAWWPETGKRVANDEWPLARALGRNEAVLNQILDIESFDGRRKNVLFSAVPTHDEHGALNGGLVVNEDISELITMQRALREEHDFIDAVLDTVGAIVLVMDRDGRVVRFNRACEEVSGYRAEELVGTHFWEKLLPPEQIERVSQVFTQLTAGHFPNQHENHWRTRDDGRRLIAWSNTCIVDANGQVHYVIATGIDVTDTRAAEAELRLAARVFEHAGEAIMVTDADNRIVKVNPAFTAITGYAAEEVLGETPARFKSGRHDAAFYLAMWHSLAETDAWEGEIWDRRRDGGIYPKWLTISAMRDSQGELRHYVALFTDISERKRSEERIRHLAEHDALTGLPNRSLLQDRLRQAMTRAEREHTRLALLFVDLDRFKLVNDSLGHAVGDALLQEVAHRLQSTARASDTVSRQGGDEFLILLADIEQNEDAGRVAQKMLDTLSEPCVLAGHELRITPSIGISLYPDDSTDLEQLIKSADIAMYQAKESGRYAYQFYTGDMNQRAAERLSMEIGLRQALERGEMLLHYQPQIELASGRIIGLEALLRWRHPEQGMIPPGRFIPIAEDSGLIVLIGEGVLHEACRQSLAWQAAGLPAVPIAVNLSAVQFRKPGLETLLRDLLAATGLAPHLLELELTESIVMNQAEETVAILGRLHALGVLLSIDDFGTGYSSLSYLKRFPIQKLKVDQSFMRDVAHDSNDAAIVRGIVSLAHSLGIGVIAEGVETREQLDFLRELGCEQAQGYYFSRPLPPAEIEPLLRVGGIHKESQ
ncbi:MAG: EAL domain-containing protein [Pseudomonadota bacterium]|nr:EAL domain-containing protein [Pseudomonadota bacterium]MDP1906114.1 EAL domain-containing protein [Pseudomonadota bacterium]MDP2353190.1 EAL domain-containing protein [Pseudomonadota bacterium]